jgi:hypothetical protein
MGGRAVRVVGVGQFAQGISRRSDEGRRQHGLRRVGSVLVGIAAAVVLVLWIVARAAGHR